MAGATPRDLHIDQLLTNVSLMYRNQTYIADQIFPTVPVVKQSNKLVKYDQSHWFRDDAKLRAPGTKSQGGGWTVDTSAIYFCDRFSYRHEVYDEERDNADQPFNLDVEATEFVTDKMQIRREVALATDFFTTSVWGTDKAGATDFTKWSDYANSSPLQDLFGWKDIVEGQIGREPNKLIMGKQVWTQLKWHPDLIDLIKYTQKGQMSQELFSATIEFPTVLVGRAIQAASPEGTAEASVSYTRVWGKNALMVYTPDRPSLMTPSAGYTFIWQRVPSAQQYIVRYRDMEREADIIEGNTYFDQKVTGATAGLFASAAVA